MTAIKTLRDMGFRCQETLAEGCARLGLSSADVASVTGLRQDSALNKAQLKRRFEFPDTVVAPTGEAMAAQARAVAGHPDRAASSSLSTAGLLQRAALESQIDAAKAGPNGSPVVRHIVTFSLDSATNAIGYTFAGRKLGADADLETRQAEKTRDTSFAQAIQSVAGNPTFARELVQYCQRTGSTTRLLDVKVDLARKSVSCANLGAAVDSIVLPEGVSCQFSPNYQTIRFALFGVRGDQLEKINLLLLQATGACLGALGGEHPVKVQCEPRYDCIDFSFPGMTLDELDKVGIAQKQALAAAWPDIVEKDSGAILCREAVTALQQAGIEITQREVRSVTIGPEARLVTGRLPDHWYAGNLTDVPESAVCVTTDNMSGLAGECASYVLKRDGERLVFDRKVVHARS